jgi:hypothetical protein
MAAINASQTRVYVLIKRFVDVDGTELCYQVKKALNSKEPKTHQNKLASTRASDVKLLT